MRATIWARYWIVVCGTLLVSLNVAAQCIDRPLPTSSSTRGLAMGDANLASRDDDVIFYGPAQLAVARGTSVAAERYADRFATGSFSTTARLASGGIGIGAQIVEARNIDPCLIPLPNGRPPTKIMTRSLAVVGAAFPFKRFRFGVAGKYASEQPDNGRTEAFLVDAGVSRDFSLGDFAPLTAAFSFQSIAPDPTRAIELGVPRRAILGFSSGGPLGPFDLGVALQGGVEHAGAGSVEVKNRPTVGGGIEVAYAWLDGYNFSLRAGARTAYAYEVTRHFTAGAGLLLDRLALDYALEELTNARYAYRLGVRLR